MLTKLGNENNFNIYRWKGGDKIVAVIGKGSIKFETKQDENSIKFETK